MADVVKALKWKLDLLKRKLQDAEISSSSNTRTITTSSISEEDQEQEELARLETTNHMLAQWNLEDFITEELYPNIAPHLFLSHCALDTLSWLLSSTLDSRISKLPTTISNSNKQGTSSSPTNIPTGFVEPEAVEDSEVKKRVLEKTVIAAKALVNEIKHDLEDEDGEKRIERRTLPLWLDEHQGVSYLSNEWSKINELRLKVIQTGVELSCVLARFVVSLGGNNDARVRRLHARIKHLSVGQRRNTGRGGVVIAGNFLSVMSYAGEGVRIKKMKGNVGEGGGVFGEDLDEMVEEFYEGALLLDAMMSTLCVPVRRNLVAGAIVRLEDMLGQVLCAMQGLKLKVGKKKNEFWKELKVKIGELWAKVECIILEEDEVADTDED